MKNSIYVFGRGTYFEEKKSEILKNYKIIGFIDNNPEGHYLTGLDIPVYEPNYLKDETNYSILLAVSSHYSIDVAFQLIQLGIDEKRILFGCKIGNPFDAGEEMIAKQNGSLFVRDGSVFLDLGKEKYKLRNKGDYINILLHLIQTNDPLVEAIRRMPVVPLSRKFGSEFGKPIDRHYIENFLESNREYIHGDVMEIADLRYTHIYGHDIKNTYMLHVEGIGNSYKGNLETGEGIKPEIVDCLICTQTLQFIYNTDKVIQNIYKLLKKGGVALVTCSFIGQIAMYGYARWGEYWRFTPLSIKKSFVKEFGEENVHIKSYGNVKTAIGLLYGLSGECLEESDYNYCDEQYPVTITVKCNKEGW